MTTSKKMEDELKKRKMKTTKINKKWKTTYKKIEDEPINQNQHNWL